MAAASRRDPASNLCTIVGEPHAQSGECQDRSPTVTIVRWLLRSVVGLLLSGGVLAVSQIPVAEHPAPRPSPTLHANPAYVAPMTRAAWLGAVDRAYRDVGDGISAEQWLRRRADHRRPGERLAVVMGIDDVMLQTHFSGLRDLVPRSVRFVKTAHTLGYAVFYVTGRSEASGYLAAEQALKDAGVPASGFFGRPVGVDDVGAGKAEARSLIGENYSLAMVVAANGASFGHGAYAEKEVRLPDLSHRR
ncbi:MAG: hypothetical protein QM572_01390 [Nocardioides sp.]|uniref:hypothetical protein n=1 Tax=Nocardioides sp. TaxID=35761 RepID=UPI0039E32A9A